MKIKYLYIIAITITTGLLSCSKKIHPDTSTITVSGGTNNDNTANSAAKKAVIKKKLQEPVPKVISVNDLSAQKTVDGRYYYDLQGHRYWRNNKDGKYYLFNKSMYTNDAFKAN